MRKLLRELHNKIKSTRIGILGLPEGGEREKGVKMYLMKLWLKTSQTCRRKQSPKSRKHRVPNRIKPKRTTPRHIIIKMAKIKDKERILKATRFSLVAFLQSNKLSILIRKLPQGYQLTFQQKLYRPEGSGTIYLK